MTGFCPHSFLPLNPLNHPANYVLLPVYRLTYLRILSLIAYRSFNPCQVIHSPTQPTKWAGFWAHNRSQTIQICQFIVAT
ncbi:hypothetical protein VN97_g6826 [Penicillium thymicola]|uniref:Uncharacterized protein n=1 Tax=Penicillium thymicola TaxID=293382 RepID=A0AAI9TG74_PENTH|nr:hypothetical protein VN97_g6826 [Penicillium thymicola]